MVPSMSDEDVRERLMDLEVRLAYQDRTITALDEVVRGLGAKLAALEHQVRALSDKAPPPTE